MLVLEGGISPEYVLDSMAMYEIEPLVSSLLLRHKESWEQTRILAYILAQVNSTKKLKPTDILSFTWDKEDKQDKNTSITNKDIERLKNKANQIIKKLNG